MATAPEDVTGTISSKAPFQKPNKHLLFAQGPTMPNNPGTIEELHKQCQSVFPMCFEGGKLMVNKGLSSRFQVSHTMNLGSAQTSGYRFGAVYIGQKMLSPTEVKTPQFPL